MSGLLGPNLNLNLVAPLGFGGAPGLFNPFGIVQAIVNALLGATFSASDGTSSTGSGMTNPPSNIGGITTVLS